jgi:hypothetical protein
MLHSHAQFALAHPVFDPMSQITAAHGWIIERNISAMLTCNIGMT